MKLFCLGELESSKNQLVVNFFQIYRFIADQMIEVITFAD